MALGGLRLPALVRRDGSWCLPSKPLTADNQMTRKPNLALNAGNCKQWPSG